MTAAAKRPILAGLSYGINVGSSFCGPQVAGLALLAALWMSDILPIPFEEPSGPTTPSFTNARQITSAVGVEDFPTWSPDGQTLAYESDQSGNMDIWVQQIGGGPPVNRTPDSEWRESNPSWSPDGSSISFLSQREERAYYTMSALGGEARKVVNTFESAMYSGPLWLSGGKELAGLGEDGNALDILALDTRQTRQVVLPVRAAGTADWSWSLDGRLLAYVEAVSRLAQLSRIWVMRLEEGESFPVTEEGNNWNPMWSRDGASLYFISNRGGAMDLWVQHVDSQRGPTGSAVPVTFGVGMRSASFSKDGSTFAYLQGRRIWNVWRVPILRDRLATWSDAEAVSSEQAYVEELDVSPDGTELVLNSDRAGNLDLWVIPLDGGEWRALTTHSGPDWAPRYSADGQKIVFHSHRNETRDLFIIPSDGGVVQPLIQSPEFELQPSFSPDGQRVVYNDLSTGDLWVVSTEEGSRRSLVEVEGRAILPDWSPDGEHIVFATIRGREASGLWIAPATGQDAMRIADTGGWSPRWSPDGRSVYFMRDQNIWTVSADSREEQRMTELVEKRGEMGLAGLATDGEYLYFTWGEDTGDIWVMDVVTDESE